MLLFVVSKAAYMFGEYADLKNIRKMVVYLIFVVPCIMLNSEIIPTTVPRTCMDARIFAWN